MFRHRALIIRFRVKAFPSSRECEDPRGVELPLVPLLMLDAPMRMPLRYTASSAAAGSPARQLVRAVKVLVPPILGQALSGGGPVGLASWRAFGVE